MGNSSSTSPLMPPPCSGMRSMPLLRSASCSEWRSLRAGIEGWVSTLVAGIEPEEDGGGGRRWWTGGCQDARIKGQEIFKILNLECFKILIITIQIRSSLQVNILVVYKTPIDQGFFVFANIYLTLQKDI